MPTLDILIPAHNEAEILNESLRRLCAVAESLRIPWQIVVVDSASTDGTAAVAEAFAKTHPHISCIRVPVLGKGAALRAGILASSADIIAYMDADLSADISALPGFLETVEHGGVDLLMGSRLLQTDKVHRQWLRTATSRLFNKATRTILGLPVKDSQCGFKIFLRTSVLPLVERTKEQGWFFDTELLLFAHRAGLRLEERPIAWEEEPFVGRKSKLRLVHDAFLVLPMLVRLRRRAQLIVR